MSGICSPREHRKRQQGLWEEEGQEEGAQEIVWRTCRAELVGWMTFLTGVLFPSLASASMWPRLGS